MRVCHVGCYWALNFVLVVTCVTYVPTLSKVGETESLSCTIGIIVDRQADRDILKTAPVGERSIAVSLSVCLFVREHISGTAGPTKFFCISPEAVARSSSGGVAIRYVLPVLWMTSRLAVVARMAMRCVTGAGLTVSNSMHSYWTNKMPSVPTIESLNVVFEISLFRECVYFAVRPSVLSFSVLFPLTVAKSIRPFDSCCGDPECACSLMAAVLFDCCSKQRTTTEAVAPHRCLLSPCSDVSQSLQKISVKTDRPGLCVIGRPSSA